MKNKFTFSLGSKVRRKHSIFSFNDYRRNGYIIGRYYNDAIETYDVVWNNDRRESGLTLNSIESAERKRNDIHNTAA